MKRALLASLLFSLAFGAPTLSQPPAETASQIDVNKQDAGRRTIPCKTPENAPLCYWTRGRLAFYNGNPPYRLWKVGTNRILSVFSGPGVWPPRNQKDQIDPELPANVKRIFDPPRNRIFANFEVCPLEPERPGWMQSVCIESATNIFLETLR